jgi:hypothetical protein
MMCAERNWALSFLAIAVLSGGGCGGARPLTRDSVVQGIARDIAVPLDTNITLHTFLLSDAPRTGGPVRVLYLLVNGHRMREIDSDPDLFRFDIETETGDRVRPFSGGSIARSSGDLGVFTLDVDAVVGGVVDVTCMSPPYSARSSECQYGFHLEPGDYRLITTYQRGPVEGPGRAGFEPLLLSDTLTFRVSQ